MEKFLVVFVASLAIASAQKNLTELSCLVCESIETPECDSTQLEDIVRIKCSELDYGDGPSSRSSLKPKKQHPVLADIFKRESRAYNNDDPLEYRCMKVRIEQDGVTRLIRSCVPLRQTVEKGCDFFKEQVPVSVHVKSCNECDTDNCNTAISFSASFIPLIVGSLLMWAMNKL